MNNYDYAVYHLKTAKNVYHLTQKELGKIDSGLIIEVLGKD